MNSSSILSEPLFEEGLQRQTARRQLVELLGQEQVQALHRRSDLWGWWAIISCWLIIAGAMLSIAWAETQSLWLAVPVIVFALALIGGRQLGLAILMHEASHRTLFKTPELNDSLANWLCGHPIFLEVHKYRKHHFVHHAKTGSPDDNDHCLVKDFPISRASLVRKLSRDLIGITGIKNLYGLMLMNAGVLKWTISSDIEVLPRQGKTKKDYIGTFFEQSWPTLLTNFILLAIVTSLGYPELFAAWVVSYLSPYPLFTRIRAMAEHAMTEQSPNMLRNTRTTKTGLISRFLFAPYYVNYHIEHHALASAPCWQLPKLHKLLRDKNAVAKPPSYWQVLLKVSSLKV